MFQCPTFVERNLSKMKLDDVVLKSKNELWLGRLINETIFFVLTSSMISVNTGTSQNRD
jgi:hypothetical protein